ncbi:MAG: PAS domain-containing protein [Candidatus Omnitrophica bacterium]|nr:PAS domain-containing protein [Candidatus Omnitrophota bacterium]
MSEIKTENMEDLKPLTTFDVAKHCKVNHRTVLQWVTSNKLKAYRTPGNHSRVDVKDFIIFLQEYNMPIPSEFMGFCNQMQNNMTRVLRTTLGKMELALGAIKEAILWTDLNGRIQWSNTTFHEIINKEKIFTLGSDIFEVLPLRTDDGVEIPKERHPVQLVISTKGFVDNYYQYIRDGHKYIFYMSIAYIKSVQNDASIIISIQDITQRRELGEEKKLLETKYESQKEFTSTVSHELRTPLAAI